MDKIEKQLLLKDLCARLPYGVKVWYPNGSGAISTVKGIVGDVCYFNENPVYGNFCHIERVKPYLRPMSSMTDEEEDEYRSFSYKVETFPTYHSVKYVDWMLEHHFDFRGLIEKGLALEAKEGMYKTE